MKALTPRVPMLPVSLLMSNPKDFPRRIQHRKQADRSGNLICSEESLRQGLLTCLRGTQRQ